MMSVHKEGRTLLLILFLLFAGAIAGIHYTSEANWITGASAVCFSLLFLFFLQFFRVPKRTLNAAKNEIISPCDGKVVVIEEVMEEEFLKKKCIQLSIFMSPLNVHVNWYPISGKVTYMKYHPGKYLVAWHPKSSTENERTTLVLKGNSGAILVRQIAGAVARRIVYYSKPGEQVNQGDELGFIKFGSRVDVFLPIDAKINVKIGDTIKGKTTVLASFNNG